MDIFWKDFARRKMLTAYLLYKNEASPIAKFHTPALSPSSQGILQAYTPKFVVLVILPHRTNNTLPVIG